MSETTKEATYTKPPRIPTPAEAKAMEKILVETQFEDGEYIALAIYNGVQLKTGGYPRPYGALKHLMNVITERQSAKGLTRDFHYIFTTRID